MMKIEYEQNGDYKIPMLMADPQPDGIITKYGMLRETFLKEHHKGVYSAFLMDGTLKKHLLTIQTQAQEMLESLMDKMQKTEQVNEELKAKNQMLWVARMESIKNRAEEIVLHDIVYSL